eukprot:3247066-Prymnesium_polylepis.1
MDQLAAWSASSSSPPPALPTSPRGAGLAGAVPAPTLDQRKQLARRAFEEHVPFLTIAHASEMLEE